MKAIISELDVLARELEKHELYEWIRARRRRDPRRNLDGFVPIINFILTFPFYNDQYLAYPGRDDAAGELAGDRGSVEEILCQVINGHVREDRTHAAFFLSDVRALDLAAAWGIGNPSALLWALWLSPMLDPAQECGMRRVRALLRPRDQSPRFRYLHVEQLERDGNALFTSATCKGPEIARRCRSTPLYFADHHLERERGHVGGSEFEAVELAPDDRSYARAIIEEKHAISLAMNDIMLGFARSAERHESAWALLGQEFRTRMDLVRKRLDDHRARRLPAANWHLSLDGVEPAPESSPHPDGGLDQSALVHAWLEHLHEFQSHPFAELCLGATGEEAIFALRCAALLFAPRICLLHTFYKFDCRLDDGECGAGAEIVRFLSDTKSTEQQIFLYDWNALQMDRLLGGDLSDVMSRLFFDPIYGRPEIEALHEFRRAALTRSDPMSKFWAFMSVGFMGGAFFPVMEALADEAAEADAEAPRMAYLGGLRFLMYQDAAPNWIDPGHPTGLAHLPVTSDQEAFALDMMNTFARCGRRAFDNLERALTTDRNRFRFLHPGNPRRARSPRASARSRSPRSP